MDQVLYHIENETPFPKNSFALTFDDGFENNMSIAAQFLQIIKFLQQFMLQPILLKTMRCHG